MTRFLPLAVAAAAAWAFCVWVLPPLLGWVWL
jgi:hypothetical protein